MKKKIMRILMEMKEKNLRLRIPHFLPQPLAMERKSLLEQST